MKYNTVYTPKTSLNDSIVLTDKIIKKLRIFFNKKFNNLIEVLVPSYVVEGDALKTKDPIISRDISFDTLGEYKVGELFTTSTNYLKKLLFEQKQIQGVFSLNSFVIRDEEENPVSTPQIFDFTIQTVINKEQYNLDFVKAKIEEVYQFIFSLAKEYAEIFDFKNIYPEFITYIDSQQFENEYPDYSYANRIDDFLIENDAFVFLSPGVKTIFGHVAFPVDPISYDLNNHAEIYLRDRVNSGALKVASVSLLSFGQKLQEQLNEYGYANLGGEKPISQWLKNEYFILEIKIDLGKLIMAILAKGHIAEAQPGVYSKESGWIKSKFKIETY